LLRIGWIGVLLVVVVAQAAPQPEVVREERFNYRLVGALPRGWKRAPAKLVWTYRIDDVPLAYVHFVRERVSGNIDVAAELKRRATHYRFPGAPKEPSEKIAPVRWGDRNAFRYEHDLTIKGVDCKRIVRAMVDNGIWYECIETLHGEASPVVRTGLACFRTGFMLLTQPIKPEAAKINDAVYGYRLEKPAGYLFEPANPGADPGCRLALIRRGPTPGQQLTIRLFEYGVRKKFDSARWLNLFDQAFRRSHTKARRESAQAPALKGAGAGSGMRLLGRRAERDVVTLIYLWQADSGRVFGLRIDSYADAAKTHAKSLEKLVGSLAFTGQER